MEGLVKVWSSYNSSHQRFARKRHPGKKLLPFGHFQNKGGGGGGGGIVKNVIGYAFFPSLCQ